eukprot:UN28805
MMYAITGRGLLNTIGRILFLGLDWGGYWLVGQFMIASPLVDLGIFKWDGWFRTANYALAIFMLLLEAYLELSLDVPFENKLFKKIFDGSRTLVYIGNLIVIIEVIVKRWTLQVPGIIIFLATLVNFIGLTMFFKDQGPSGQHKP